MQTVTKIEDLKFAEFGGFVENVEGARVFFDNGYGASIVRRGEGYNGGDGFFQPRTSDSHPYELAVIFGRDEDWELTYDTPVTDDVIGYLNDEDLIDTLARIENLDTDGKKKRGDKA